MSPELYIFIVSIKTENFEDIEKSNIFSIGLIILRMLC